ncbi:PTS lactose transporter subunit IIC [Microbacterium paludicola]|uniref:PTS lactose transporter subunit IIC n=1 Tax=Microbacterium paludicola TaxID=300019 RepID=A0A4Y9FWB9_9MICO|nr:fructose-specific PTS transporter subunit EIIC [Microbacterium paludicola]MBF0816526.1 PTS sugar transporter subunit IIA [Microbacterium paludicola]TFU32831.1 PTS lactose transporter subunit IIC [Microbacterium paludicola]
MSTITPQLVSLDEDLGPDKQSVLRALSARFVAQGRATDADALFAAAWKREEQDATGLPGGIAIPHAKSAVVTQASLAFARLKPGVDFGAEDEPSDIVFMIAAPDTAAEEHLAVLSKLARNLMDEDFLAALRGAADADEAVRIVRAAIGEEAASETAAAPAPAAAAVPTAAGDGAIVVDGRPARIVAVTACATGIAHTYMAADALTAAAKKAGVEFQVEPQGSSGYTAIDPAVIAAADAVVFAVDVDVREPQRFAGKPVIRRPVKAGIEHATELLTQAAHAAEDPSAERVPGTAGAAEENERPAESIGARIKRVLLTGVSYMIPFVAGGGLLMALGFLLGGYQINEVANKIAVENALWNLPDGGLLQYLGAVAFAIGNISMSFLVPALAGYIAYALADRPGIAPGFVAGSVAVLMNAGFIGGIVGGVLAGLAAMWLGSLTVPRWLRGLMPVVIIPLLGSIFASGLLILFLAAPIAALMTALTGGLNGLATSGLLPVVGIILGLMMCFDLGGPINKVAYAFAVAGLGAGSAENPVPFYIMGAAMAAGMVPPLMMAFASTVLDRGAFSEPERENGKAAWLLGLSFISEGAIPFAAADPLRVIPASMLGGAVTGFLSMLFEVGSRAPHGGAFVFFAIDPLWGFAIALLAGVLVGGFAVVGLKRLARRRVEAVAA